MRQFVAVIVALVLVVGSSFVPSSSRLPGGPIDRQHVQVHPGTLPPAAREKLDAQLAALTARGYRIGATQSAAVTDSSRSGSWWSRMFTAHADFVDSQRDSTYMSITDVYDGDDSAAKGYVYIYDNSLGASMGAVAAISRSNPDQVWVEGVSTNLADARGVDRFFHNIAPVALARPNSCYGASVKEVFQDATYEAARAGAGSVVPCLFTNLGFGVCVGISAGSFFFGSLYVDFWWWAYMCAFYMND
jgi:hypothetical protein